MAKIKMSKTGPKMPNAKLAVNRVGPLPKIPAQKLPKMPKATPIKLTPAVETVKKAKKRFGL